MVTPSVERRASKVAWLVGGLGLAVHIAIVAFTLRLAAGRAVPSPSSGRPSACSSSR